MHIQELETIRRQGISLLIAIINDGGYGAETHKFRAHGVIRKRRSMAAATSRASPTASGSVARR